MRILLIVQPERFDFYAYLALAENVEWVLLWYEKPGQMALTLQDAPLNFSRICYWTEFATPKDLLNNIKPDRIIFFEIIDLRQIALNVAAMAQNIPTFYLEHGAAGDKDTAEMRWQEVTFSKHKLPYLAKRFYNSFFDVLRSKFFYYSVLKGFHSIDSFRKYLFLPFQMFKGAPNKVLAQNKFRERVPLKSIVFNKVNFDEYNLYTGISPEEALFTGVPFIDDYYNKSNRIKEYLVYIDHPYLEENILNWTEEHHRQVADTLFSFAEQRKMSIYIKLHPRSDAARWQQYAYNKEYVTIIQERASTNLFLEAKLILGFGSSLINGFLCARKNVVLLGWHPEARIYGADFSKTGLCHVSFSPKDLIQKYDVWISHNLTMENNDQYNAFLSIFNQPFDGKATDRVIKAITEDEVS